MKWLKDPRFMKRFHGAMTMVWGIILILASIAAVAEFGFGKKLPPIAWLLGVAFISLCSIYANMMGHWGTSQAASSEESQEDPGVKLKK